MKIFLINNIILYGDSCCGKTFFYKNIFFNKLDLDFFFNYKKIYFKSEFFFRYIEFNFFKNNKKNLLIILGGGSLYLLNYFLNYFLIFKNVLINKQIKRFFINKLNRPMYNKNNNFKLRYCLRKKKYIKMLNIYFNKCFYCNIKNL
ncbi:putative shikimate kinase I [Candidatus Carsonella ruddii CS isolate Thao2000]|uniref:Putative shikimate kinase I n=1 Tax=Candidatus Carsonella ruddii CS isolate Thao2000 TaxID=1202537 RepID=J7GW87_CARRU|nr:hypothetical protein [Candidatus Carsonella ruddii]AFP83691.1 putative shikimate kinase I [Candidatus Carsonella ruddii CS isolate Thao2000]